MSSYTLPHRAFLRLHGPDAARYLNGQITQKVEDADGSHVLWTAVTNAKGGIEGIGCIQQLPDGSYLFDCPLELGDEMEMRVDKYLIADDCEWVREDERWQITIGEGNTSTRYRTPMLESVSETPSDAPPLPPELESQWCAQYAVPRWGLEITGGQLPAEVGLHSLALSFNKGCYIGQEIISRMEAAGKTRTKLYQVKSSSPLSEDEYTTTASIDGIYYGLTVARQAPEGSKAY